MWTWTPQLRVEHRFEFEPAQVKVEAGLLDPISVSTVVNNYLRLPTPGENSRQPAYALRLSAGNKSEGSTPRNRSRRVLQSAGIPLWIQGSQLDINAGLEDWIDS